MRIPVLLAISLALSGCATQSTPSIPLNLAEAEFAKSQGKSSVRGQLFLRRNDGIVVYGAGSDVLLIPRTSYSDSVITTSFGSLKMRQNLIFGMGASGGRAPQFDPSFLPYVRAAKADGQGNFAFSRVPPGQYYALGVVKWCAPTRHGCDEQGGDLYESLTVRPADSDVSVIMSGT